MKNLCSMKIIFGSLWIFLSWFELNWKAEKDFPRNFSSLWNFPNFPCNENYSITQGMIRNLIRKENWSLLFWPLRDIYKNLIDLKCVNQVDLNNPLATLEVSQELPFFIESISKGFWRISWNGLWSLRWGWLEFLFCYNSIWADFKFTRTPKLYWHFVRIRSKNIRFNMHFALFRCLAFFSDFFWNSLMNLWRDVNFCDSWKKN